MAAIYEYEKLELLGSGSYGKAWLVNCQKKNTKEVLKEIRLDILSEKEMDQALVEVRVLSRCRHVNIVSYSEAFLSAGCLHIVMEYAEGGDMQKKILDQRGIHFDKEIILDWFIQICFALKYLHSENILHRDLKPQNLFLTSDGIVKLGDFGIARILQSHSDHALTAIGTPYYLSPEICQHLPYNFKSDIWAAGCVLYELCTLRVPFQAQNLPMLVLKILKGQYNPIPRHYGAVMEDLVAILLGTDPAKRPSAEQIITVPALQSYVKSTYRKCIRHKQGLVQAASVAKQCISSNHPAPDEHSPAEQKIFTVESPLLRKLSMASPKLKRAIQHQRVIHSAEALATVKKKSKGNPPNLNLHLMIQKHPKCISRHFSDFESEAYCRRDAAACDDNYDDDDDDDDDDVFETKEDNSDKVKNYGTQLHSNSEQGHKCSINLKQADTASVQPVLEPEIKDNLKNAKAKWTKAVVPLTENDQGVEIKNENFCNGEDPVNKQCLQGEQIERSSQPALRKGSEFQAGRKEENNLKRRPQAHFIENSSHRNPHQVQENDYCGTEAKRLGIQCEKDCETGENKIPRQRDMIRPTRLPCNDEIRRKMTNQRTAHSYQIRSKGVNQKMPHSDEIRNNASEIPKTQKDHKVANYILQSVTYSVEQKTDATELNKYALGSPCVSCPECINRILYKVASLVKKKIPYQGLLTEYLNSHIGAARREQFCSIVSLSLQNGAEYSVLESSWDQSCKSYFPVVLQLVMPQELS